MGCMPKLPIARNATTMEFSTVFAGAHLKFLFKNLLDNLLLGSFQLLDKSLGAIYCVLDARFEGLAASQAKDIILPHNPSSLLSSSSLSSSSSRSSSSRSSHEFGVEDNILFHDFNSTCIDHDHLKELSISAPGSSHHNNAKPRRAGIIAERQQKNAKNFFCSEGGAPSCACWGWHVEEESLDDEQMPLDDNHQEQELLDGEDDDDDDQPNSSGRHGLKVRWSECQCPDCKKLWMPMSKARSRLHVQIWNASNNNNSDLDLNRNPSRSLRRFAVESSIIDQPTRAQQLADGGPTSLRRSASDLGAARSSSWNSNLMNGAKSELQSPPNFSSSNVVEERETKTTGVIFLHGIFSSSDFWFDSNIVLTLDGEIKSRHLILVPDLLGCGRSPRPHDSLYTLRDQVDALENSLVKKHSLESFHIVGHSMGTIPALALAARFPNRVRSLTLIAPVYAGYTDPKQSGDEILTDCNSILSYQDPWSARALRSLTASQHYNINRFLGHLLFSRHQRLVPIFQRLLQDRWPRSFVRDYLAVTHDAAWHIVHNTMIGGSHALVPALRKLRDRRMRVFVIHGTDDTSCPFKQSVLMTQHFENVVLAPLQGKGHVDIVLGGHDEVLPLLEKEIRLGDRNFFRTETQISS